MRNIAQNLGFALGYNSIGIAIAAGVLYPFTGTLLNPMIAGARWRSRRVRGDERKPAAPVRSGRGGGEKQDVSGTQARSEQK